MRLKIIFLSAYILIANLIYINAQENEPPFLRYLGHPWVDSLMKVLSTEEKIAQLIWIAAYSNRDISYDFNLSNIIKDNEAGGIVFFQGTAGKQAEMINHFRTISKVPPMIAIDGEWGIGMRLEKVIKFPYQLTLGAIRDDSLIYKMGSAVATQCKRAGINVNLAPVADVNNNPANTVINFRSFGEDPRNVSRKTNMYMKGLQDNGIIAVAKHFPGHGDTETDSHLNLPVIQHTRERLDSVELLPFRALINNGISGVMPGHLSVPAIESGKDIPSTISGSVLTGLLKNELGFKGLIISDAMNMGGITRYTKPGEAEALSLEAGMDLLEYVPDPEQAIRIIAGRIKKGEISIDSIDRKCRKILAAKYWAGLNKAVPVDPERIESSVSSPDMEVLVTELYSNALTLINNRQNIIPVSRLDSLRIATVAVNRSSLTDYQRRIASYVPVDHYYIGLPDSINLKALARKLDGYDLIIAGIFGTDQRSSMNFGIQEGLNKFIELLNAQNRCIITYFGNPYAIARIEAIQKSEGLLIAYQENKFTEDLSAQLIFGAISAKGILPVTINDRYPVGYGISSPGSIRLKYGLPESAGISSEYLNSRIDSIAGGGITAGAYPGCEIMVAIKGTVIFQKSYGYHTYDNRTPVAEDDLFDLASVTKIAGLLPGLMKLNSEGKFLPGKTVGFYLPEYRKSNKSNLILKDILAHQAGLKSWIPFWKESLKRNGEFRSNTFSHESSDKYPIKVAQNLYAYKNYEKKIVNEIRKSKLTGDKKFIYSDLGFIIMPDIITNLAGINWDEYVSSDVYRKLGAYDIGFNPYPRYPLSRIVPTEYDSLFRKQQIHGTVHDEGAAVLGGISGHAGLFATATDLMKLMEMYRRMGNYGGEQLISEDIVKEYTSCQFPENNNRRGLGFDKPQVSIGEPDLKNPYPTRSASPESFGHTGFTGPLVWVDPEYEITYIFLCNRVYPSRDNNLLMDMNIRTEILQVIYYAINKSENE